MQRFAASCYFSARSFSKAAEVFKTLEQWNQVGECLVRIGKHRYREAASFFEKGDMALRAIETYEQVKEWELLLMCLNRSQDKFGESERQSLINKYVPVALNNIYQQYGMVEKQEHIPEGDRDNIGQKVEQKIQEKYKTGTDVIEEDDELDEYGDELEFEDSEGSESDKDEESKKENILDAEELKEDEPGAADSDSGDEGDADNLMSKGFQLESIIKDDLNEKKKDVEDQEKAEVNDSFEIIDSMEEENLSQGSNQSANKNDEEDADAKRADIIDKMRDLGDSFDHLSQYDPDDEFLKSNRSLSIIESIIAKDGRIGSSAVSESSEFSIISSKHVQSVISSIMSEAQNDAMKQINFIEDRDDDNYVQDVIAQKIIYYLSLWSDDMRKQLSELKRQGIMHEVDKDAKNETIDETDFIIQMDDVDADFVNLILDTLEVYEFYHMSLMMCKRYRLSGRQGRYLVLMCSKYSNLNRNRVNFVKLVRTKFL